MNDSSQQLPEPVPEPEAAPAAKAIIAVTFIGFATLEGWADAVDPARPVLALPLVEPGPNTGGMQTDELLVVCQQVSSAGDNAVLYCHLRAASLTRCHGEPFDPDWQERKAAWKSLWTLVHAYLAQERGFLVQQATVACPRNLLFLRGRAGFVRFDNDAKRYRRSSSNSDAQETRTEAA